MIKRVCDHCEKPILENQVIYELRPLNSYNVPMMSYDLHWDCIPLFGRVPQVYNETSTPGEGQ